MYTTMSESTARKAPLIMPFVRNASVIAAIALWVAHSCGAAEKTPPGSGQPTAPQPIQVHNKKQAPEEELIFVIPIHDAGTGPGGMIDYWQASFVRRKVAEAKEAGATKIILDINTNGGIVDACIQIQRILDDAGDDIEFIAYVSEKALSGGAYLALACDRIYMKPGTWKSGGWPTRNQAVRGWKGFSHAKNTRISN